MDQISAIKSGDKRAAAKLISMLENNNPKAAELLQRCAAPSVRAKVIGITGAPGAGKSTLTDQLTKNLLKNHKKIGIIAVDPSSPISGGAFLGDRIRMSDLNSQPDVFIRSMATRGALGGISKAVSGAIRVMELFGADYIFIETVGIGQSEIDVAGLSDIVVLVVVPGMGDDIQAEKAGILEVSDIIVVNKADHEDTNRTIQQLKSMMGLRMKLHPEEPVGEDSEIEIVSTIATTGFGLADLLEAIDARQIREQAGGLTGSSEKRLRAELLDLIYKKVESEFMDFDEKTLSLSISVVNILEERSNPFLETERLLEEFMKWRSTTC